MCVYVCVHACACVRARVYNSYHIDGVSALHVICLLNFMLFFGKMF